MVDKTGVQAQLTRSTPLSPPAARDQGKGSDAFVGWCALACLAAYSLALLTAEFVGGEALARDLCSDILGKTRFHAVNTSLSVFVLAAGALLLVFTVATRTLDRRERRYFQMQAALLAWLAFDDRFLVHESLGERLHIPDAAILLTVGLGQLVLLFTMARLRERRRHARWLLMGAAFSFGVMCGIDGLQDRITWPGRLTLEDLTKTWGGACLLGFVWSVCAAPLGGRRIGTD